MPFDKNECLRLVKESLEFFNRSTRELQEESSEFMPAPGMFTAAQQIAHSARTIHWFLDGAFSPAGFKMDFDNQTQELGKVVSINAARVELEQAIARAIRELEERPAAEWEAKILDKHIMAGEPRTAAITGIVEHTAHHRGALTVYARLLGRIPPMPYAEM